jgi:hypothetical protein
MRGMIAIALVLLCGASWDGAMPSVEDVEFAECELAHLRNREMKRDSDGRVVYLDISEQDLVDDNTLRTVTHLPHLVEFYAIFCRVHGDGLESFEHLKHLEKLDLFATRLDDNGMKWIAKLESLKYLDVRTIEFRGPGNFDNIGPITDKGLASISKLPNLETLRISGKLTDEGIRQIVGLRKLRLLEIHTSGGVTESGLEWLQSQMPELEIE